MINAHWPPIYDARRLPVYSLLSAEQALSVVFDPPPSPVDITAAEHALDVVIGGTERFAASRAHGLSVVIGGTADRMAARANSLTVVIGGTTEYSAARAHSLTVVFSP